MNSATKWYKTLLIYFLIMLISNENSCLKIFFNLMSPLVDPESEKRGPSVKGNLFLNENAAETVYDWVTRTHLQGRTENETHQGESSMWPLAD